MRSKAGKLSLCPLKQEMVVRETAFHLGKLSSEIGNGIPRKQSVFNADETHYVIDNSDGRTLAMKGDQPIKFRDVVSGDEGMVMMVLLGGSLRLHLRVPMTLFQKRAGSYQFRGFPDDVPEPCYRTGPKEWMNRRVLLELLKAKLVFHTLPGGKNPVLTDMFHGHRN